MSVVSDILALRQIVHAAFENDSKIDENESAQILEELKNLGGDVVKNCELIVEVVKTKMSGKPLDDRTMMVERLIGLVSALPETSFARKKMTGVLVEQLWDSMQHPPLSYVGDQYQFRQADGSHNNIMYPNLGKAGTPYARTIRTENLGKGARPDPGLLFDLLMSRGDTFDENPCGISSILFYHAAIITHDIFHTSRKDADISDTSSYLDLAPLYGSNQAAQNKVRTFIDGQLKPDTFNEKRLLGFPPGVNVLLVMYSRFHNYAAKMLEAINESERFTPPGHLRGEEKLAWKDEQLFQVARLVTNGLYANIGLHDYLRAISNVPATDSSWTLDPRVEITKIFDKEGTPRGVGNQVSCEFNLLYRFHSAISNRDSKWTKEFFAGIFPGEDPLSLPIPKLLQGIGKFESQIPDDPSVRTFGGLKRDASGKFNDDELVQMLKESIEDPAGRFGANHVPDILKPVEVLGIIQARKWQVASLNEFRKFFGLKTYEKFEEINPEPYVANTLKRLYGHPDHVEMYPGMFLEATKPPMEPGMGLCVPYSASRAILSDAITLVRSDRFLTLDYTPANLTNWGITEVASDMALLGGAKMHHLILNAFPNHFKFNSVYAMQPLYTPKANRKMLTKQKKADLFDFAPPARQPAPILIANPLGCHATITAVLADKKNFRVPWGPKMSMLANFMLASDTDATAAQRELVCDALYGTQNAMQNFAAYTELIATQLLKRESYQLGRGEVYQVDVVKNIANLAAVHFAADLCYLPLQSKSGVSYTEDELYKVLTNLTAYVFSDIDPTKSWARRRESQRGTSKLCSEMEEIVKRIPQIAATGCPADKRDAPKTLLGKGLRFGADRVALRVQQGKALVSGRVDAAAAAAAGEKHSGPLADYGINFARTLQAAGKKPSEIAEILVGMASAFVANTATALAQLIDFYLEGANKPHWKEIVRLTGENSTDADQKLTKYVLEGMRLSNTLAIVRNVEPVSGETATITQGDKTVTAKRGDRVVLSFVSASNDPAVFPSPTEVRLDRPIDAYITFGDGPHECLGKDLNIVFSLTMLKVFARLKGLRRTPGDEGRLKSIPRPGGFTLYMDPNWSEFTPYPTSMKLMWDGAP